MNLLNEVKMPVNSPVKMKRFIERVARENPNSRFTSSVEMVGDYHYNETIYVDDHPLFTIQYRSINSKIVDARRHD